MMKIKVYVYGQERQNIESVSRFIKRSFILLCIIFSLFHIFPITVSASSEKMEVPGNVYEFDKGSHYEFHESNIFAKSEESDTYGTFFINGNISNVSEHDGIPSYEVSDGNLNFFYNYGDALLNADVDSWHLIEDKSKKVADMTLESNIMKGALILQTSKDRKTWIDAKTVTNAFGDMPVQTDSIYSTSEVQLINGCFYRVIVVYELRIRTKDSNFLFVNMDKYDYKKYAEVYEFYVYTDSGEKDMIGPNQTYNIGSMVRTKEFKGYFDSKEIDKKDIHYGWELGHFFVSGYTSKIANADDDMVFLKNPGDKVILWFKLNENINALRGNEKLSITADSEGSDQYFQTPTMNFGRGALLIRYTDYNNNPAEPAIYTNFLEANATVGADTKVQLFEEGDYEVALDYEVTSDELIDKKGHYRIFFKFSVRNGNCMFYLFDIATGSELANSSITEKGFRLDLAKSRYLDVNIKREVLKNGADGLVEDTRFNAPAKDGEEYTEEGVYTITATSEYVEQPTVKKIYVGTNNVLRAYIATGLSIPEINLLISQGATISDDGTILLASTESSVEQPNEKESPVSGPEQSAENNSETQTEEASAETYPSYTLAAIIGACIVLAMMKKRKKRNKTKRRNRMKDKGGMD